MVTLYVLLYLLTIINALTNNEQYSFSASLLMLVNPNTIIHVSYGALTNVNMN